jgi:hypothetical protein
MSFRLSKRQDADWQRAIGRTRSARDALNEAVGAYNATLNGLRDMAMQMARDWRGEYDARSGRWRDSHRGQVVNDWIEAWEDYDPVEEGEPDDSAIVAMPLSAARRPAPVGGPLHTSGMHADAIFSVENHRPTAWS